MAQQAPLLSTQWFRIASLKPRLDPHLTVERLAYRGQIWHVLVSTDGSRSFRLNAAAYAFVGRCDGTLSVQRLWDLLLIEMKDDAPTQEELLQLLARMHAAALVTFDRRPDFGPFVRAAGPSVGEAPARPNSLLSVRIPLGSPDRLLARLAPCFRWLFTPATLAVWAVIVLTGLVAASLHAEVVAAQAMNSLGSPRVLLLAWLAYPMIKGLHELAHGLAVKHWGGTIREWGITLLMFVPVPYVDASSASGFARTRRRVVVSAAGIMAELVLAALALAIAMNAEPGWFRDLSFVVVFIGAVSTLLVNGNPLLRFDGYHMLVDALELPNLATRSANHWNEQLRRCALGGSAERNVVAAPGETPWLWAYAPAALLYRLAASAALVVWLGSLSFVLGAAIAGYLGWLFVGKPVLALGRFLHGPTLADGERARAWRLVAAGGVAFIALTALLPLPFSSVVQGVVWPPEQALLRAGTDGFVEEVHVDSGARAARGQALLALQSPTLVADRARIEARIRALETDRFQSLRGDAARSISLERELDSATAELALIDERTEQLAIRARADGLAIIARAEDLPGRFVKRGTLLGHVLTREPALVRVAIPHEQAALVRTDSRAVAVRLVDHAGESWRGELVGDVSGAATRLPSPALGDRNGGTIATDPGDRDGLTPAEGVVLADIRLPDYVAPRIGSRAWVRFDHGFAPLAPQAARRLQQLFLKHFNPAQ